jgi:hypothetical protein
VFGAADQGFVRLKVRQAATGASAVSKVQGWMRMQFAAAAQTFSMPFMIPEIYRGNATQVHGQQISLDAARGLHELLNAGGECYAEIVAGPHEGQRFEIDEANSADGTVSLDLGSTLSTLTEVPADLPGARIAIRRHWTVGLLFPAGTFAGGLSADDSDRLQFLDSGSQTFYSTWLSSTSGWSGEIGADYVIAPGESLFVTARNGMTVTYTGEVRSNAFAQPLTERPQLIGNGFPLRFTPGTIGLTIDNGFEAAPTPADAAQFQVWRGDSSPESAAYRTFFYQAEGARSFWADESDAGTDRTDEELFEIGRGFIVTPRSGKPDRVVPCPWSSANDEGRADR